MRYDPKDVQPTKSTWHGMLAIVVCALIGVAKPSISQGQQPTELASPTTPQTQIDPNQLLLQAIHKAVWGPTISCLVQQETYLFEQKQIGIGQYAHSGAGEGQLKLVVRFSTSRSQSTFYQISDGRLVWSFANDGHPPKRVYLDRVRQSLGGLSRDPQNSINKTLYFAIGGQAGLMRGLYHRYRWYKLYTFQNDPNVWEMVGTLRQTPASPAAQSPFDQFQADGEGSDLLPTDARIRLGRGGDNDLILQRVEYVRRVLDDRGEFKGYTTVSKIDYSDIKIGSHLEDDAFEFEDHAANPEDETSLYMPITPVAEATAAEIR
jgi:hypothetical protein